MDKSPLAPGLPIPRLEVGGLQIKHCPVAAAICGPFVDGLANLVLGMV